MSPSMGTPFLAAAALLLAGGPVAAQEAPRTGERVRVTLADASRHEGTLVRAGHDTLVILPTGAEAPLAFPLAEARRLDVRRPPAHPRRAFVRGAAFGFLAGAALGALGGSSGAACEGVGKPDCTFGSALLLGLPLAFLAGTAAAGPSWEPVAVPPPDLLTRNAGATPPHAPPSAPLPAVPTPLRAGAPAARLDAPPADRRTPGDRACLAAAGGLPAAPALAGNECPPAGSAHPPDADPNTRLKAGAHRRPRQRRAGSTAVDAGLIAA